MMGTMALIVGSGLIGAGASYLGGQKAAKAQKAAAAGLAAQQKQNEGYLAPYMTAGTSALKTYQDALGLNGADAQKAYYSSFQTDPGWESANQYALNQTNDRYRLSGQTGGNVQAALYNQGQQNMLAAYNTRLSQLSGLVNTGQNAASTLVGSGTTLAGGAASLLGSAGQSKGAGIAGAGKALGGALGGLGTYGMYKEGLGGGLLGSYSPGTAATGGWSTATIGGGGGGQFLPWVQ